MRRIGALMSASENDAGYQSRSTHTPSFDVAPGAKLVTPNLPPASVPGCQRFAIIGGGKTAMDVCIWLLQMGVNCDNVRRIVPREQRPPDHLV
jgi:hypothetical protein